MLTFIKQPWFSLGAALFVPGAAAGCVWIWRAAAAAPDIVANAAAHAAANTASNAAGGSGSLGWAAVGLGVALAAAPAAVSFWRQAFLRSQPARLPGLFAFAAAACPVLWPLSGAISDAAGTGATLFVGLLAAAAVLCLSRSPEEWSEWLLSHVPRHAARVSAHSKNLPSSKYLSSNGATSQGLNSAAVSNAASDAANEAANSGNWPAADETAADSSAAFDIVGGSRHWSHRFCREGLDQIEGLAAATFSAGQTISYVHLAFCPPFDSRPEVEAESDEAAARVLAAAIYPHGCRLEVRRSQGEAPAAFVIRYAATSPAE